MRSILASLLMVTLVTGCVYPTTGVRVTDDRPTLAIKGAPRDALLYVDGLSMGLARNFEGGSRVLLLEPGTHKIEVRSGGTILLSETVFLGSGAAKTLSVTRSGETQ